MRLVRRTSNTKLNKRCKWAWPWGIFLWRNSPGFFLRKNYNCTKFLLSPFPPSCGATVFSNTDIQLYYIQRAWKCFFFGWFRMISCSCMFSDDVHCSTFIFFCLSNFGQSLRDSWYRVLGVVVPTVDVGSLDVVVAWTVVVASVVVVICVVGSSVVVVIEVVVSSVVDVTTINGAQTNNCICYYLSRNLY